MSATSSDNLKGNEEINKLECAICLDSCFQPVELPCHHIFCYLCVKGVSQQNGKCALCRKTIPINYLNNPHLVGVQQSTLAHKGSYQWFYKGRNGWWQYDDRTSLEIDAACKRGADQCDVVIAGVEYIIDFQNNLQIRRDNPFCCRRIKQDLVTISKKGVAGIRFNPNELPVSNASTGDYVDSSTTVCPVGSFPAEGSTGSTETVHTVSTSKAECITSSSEAECITSSSEAECITSSSEAACVTSSSEVISNSSSSEAACITSSSEVMSNSSSSEAIYTAVSFETISSAGAPEVVYSNSRNDSIISSSESERVCSLCSGSIMYLARNVYPTHRRCRRYIPYALCNHLRR